MGFLSKIFGGGASRIGEAASTDRDGIHFYVRCEKCGEKIHIRASRQNDVSDDYDGEVVRKMLNKEILGSRCQNLMYAHLGLDQSGKIVESTMERCILITKEEYES